MSDYTIIMRNILEVRLKEKVFAFLDFRGEFIDFLINNYDGKKIRYLNNGSRIDIATEDLKKVIFFGFENFGFQIEMNDDFENFKNEIDNIFKIIDEFNKYKYKKILRIGVKSFIYCHKKGKSLEAMKGFYKEKMFKEADSLEKITNSKIVDFGYLFNDVEIGKTKANITTGPVDAQEALTKFFDSDEMYVNKITKPGIMYIMDCFRSDIETKEYTNDELIKEIKENITNTENSFEKFRDFIFKELDEEK